MGASYVSTRFKNVELTDQRRDELFAVIAAMTEADIPESETELDLFGWQSKLQSCVTDLRDLPETEDEVTLSHDNKYMETGGSTWGDAPTGAFSTFVTLYDAPALIALIDRYFLEDYPDEAPSTMCSTAGEVEVRLRDGKVIRSGWIDKHDPNALPAGDYLAVDDKTGAQLFYVDSADLFADPINGRKLLLQMLQACM